MRWAYAGLIVIFVTGLVYVVTAPAPIACKRAGGSYTLLDGRCTKFVLVDVPFKVRP